jgi:hypothetical protein
LYSTLARSKRKGQGRTRPRLSVGEEGKHRGMLLVDWPHQHDDLARLARRE